MTLDLCMTEGAVLSLTDFSFISSMFTHLTDPELIVHQWTTTDNTSRKPCVTAGTYRTPVNRNIIIVSVIYYKNMQTKMKPMVTPNYIYKETLHVIKK